MRECGLIYFLSFAQIEKKEQSKQKKRLSRGSAEAFIFYWIIIIVPLSVQDSPFPTFLL